MPAKSTSQRSGQAANGGTDASPKKGNFSRSLGDSDKKEKDSGVSFEVYQSEAATFLNIGEYRKAINSYTRVSAYSCIWYIEI